MKEIYTKDNGVALVDDDDYNWLSKYSWYQDYRGYFCTCVKQKITRMHRMIVNCPTGLVVDHINSNKSDNRKENLRICTYQQNSYNIKPSSDVKYKGVSWNSKEGKWQARATHKNVDYICGLFDTEKEAAKAYNEKSRELRGEYAYQNII